MNPLITLSMTIALSMLSCCAMMPIWEYTYAKILGEIYDDDKLKAIKSRGHGRFEHLMRRVCVWELKIYCVYLSFFILNIVVMHPTVEIQYNIYYVLNLCTILEVYLSMFAGIHYLIIYPRAIKLNHDIVYY